MDSAIEANHSPPLSGSRVASMDINRKASIDRPGSRKISMSGTENRKASIDGNSRASVDGGRRASIDRKVGRRNMLKPVLKAPGFSYTVLVGGPNGDGMRRGLVTIIG
jgi:hypothetical protein